MEASTQQTNSTNMTSVHQINTKTSDVKLGKEYYKIDKIVGHYLSADHKFLYYLIRWENFTEEYDTYELCDNLVKYEIVNDMILSYIDEVMKDDQHSMYVEYTAGARKVKNLEYCRKLRKQSSIIPNYCELD